MNNKREKHFLIVFNILLSIFTALMLIGLALAAYNSKVFQIPFWDESTRALLGQFLLILLISIIYRISISDK